MNSTILDQLYIEKNDLTYRVFSYSDRYLKYDIRINAKNIYKILKKRRLHINLDLLLAHLTEELIKHPKPHLYAAYINQKLKELEETFHFLKRRIGEKNEKELPTFILQEYSLSFLEVNKLETQYYGLIHKIHEFEFDKEELNEVLRFSEEIKWGEIREKINEKYPSIIKKNETWHVPSEEYYSQDLDARIYWPPGIDKYAIYNSILEVVDEYNTLVISHYNLFFYLDAINRLKEFSSNLSKQVDTSLNNIISNRLSKISTEDIVNYQNEIAIEQISHKILMAHKIGLLEFLERERKDKYSDMEDADYYLLVKTVLGINGSEDHVRKTIRALGTKGKDNPETSKALKKIRKELAKVKIHIK